MSVSDWATAGLIACFIMLVAIVDDWATPMLERAASFHATSPYAKDGKGFYLDDEE